MITPGIVVFDPAAFIAQFSAFSTVPTAALQNNFSLATLQLNNSYGSIVQDAPTRAQLLNLLTAHLTALLNGVGSNPPSDIVGRISGASQGSVSVQTEFRTDSEAAAFYTQTKWGAIYWQSTAIYRTAHYVSGHAHAGESWDAWPQ